MKIKIITILSIIIFKLCYSQNDQIIFRSESIYLDTVKWEITFYEYIMSQYKILNKIECCNSGIKKIPKQVINDTIIDFLDMSNHQIKNIYRKTKVLKNKQIKIFKLNNLKNPKALPDFRYLHDLEILDLRNSYIIDIVPKLIDNKHLKAVFPNLFCFQDSLVWKLDSLEYLQCHPYKSIYEIPDEMTRFKDLKGLQFYIAPSLPIGEKLYKLQKVEYLNIIIHDIDSLIINFNRLPFLKQIDIFSTNLSYISDELFHLQQLNNLNIYCHNFSIQQQNYIISKLPNTRVFFGKGEYNYLKKQIQDLQYSSIRSCLEYLKKSRKK